MATTVEWSALPLNYTASTGQVLDTALAKVPVLQSTTAAPLGLVTGLIMAVAINSHLDTKVCRSTWQLLLTLTGLAAAVLTFLLLAVYRQCVGVLLLILHGAQFEGLMSGPDAVWCVSDTTSQPVINVLATVRALNAAQLLGDLRERLGRAALVWPCLARSHHMALGYSYWRRDALHPQEQVRFMQIGTSLQHTVSQLANAPLPRGDSACWEVLVAQEPLDGNTYPILFRVHHALGDGVALQQLLITTLATTTQVTYQNSSSYLDGELSTQDNTESLIVLEDEEEIESVSCSNQSDISIIEHELLDITADSERTCDGPESLSLLQDKNFDIRRPHSPVPPFTRSSSTLIEKLNDSHEEFCKVEILSRGNSVEDSLPYKGMATSCDPQNLSSLERPLKIPANNCYIDLLDEISESSSMYQRVIRHVQRAVFASGSADRNSLHRGRLSGEKLLVWHTDSADGAVLSSVKRVKHRFRDARFTDVILTALSASLCSYFTDSGSAVPDDITVVLPARLQDTHTLGNHFSLALLPLPLQASSLEARLRKVCQHTSAVRCSSQYLLNSWILRMVAVLLPLPVLGTLLAGPQSTLVVSNLLGPPSSLLLAGYELMDLIFWVPNRGHTGVGVSILSYAGRLQLGLVADRALLREPEDAQQILDELVVQLFRLDSATQHIRTDA